MWFLLVFQIFLYIFGSRVGIYGDIIANKWFFLFGTIFLPALLCLWREKGQERIIVSCINGFVKSNSWCFASFNGLLFKS